MCKNENSLQGRTATDDSTDNSVQLTARKTTVVL